MEDIILTKSERTSQVILDSAYNLFTSQGYAATSMRQIAEHSSLALGGIYNHFESKEKIFEEVVMTRHPIFVVMPHIRQASGETVDEFIRNAARSMVAELGQHPEFLNLMLTELIEFKGAHVQRLIEKILPEMLEFGQQIQAYQPGLRPIAAPLLMRAFVGLFFSFFITELMLKDIIPAGSMQVMALDQVIDIFLYGVTLPAGSSLDHPAANFHPGSSETL